MDDLGSPLSVTTTSAAAPDHRHVESKQQPYTFSTPEQLTEDFLAAVRRLRGK